MYEADLQIEISIEMFDELTVAKKKDSIKRRSQKWLRNNSSTNEMIDDDDGCILIRKTNGNR